MIMTVMIVSIVFTIAILALTLLTISKGYGYKHTIDDKPSHDKEHHTKK